MTAWEFYGYGNDRKLTELWGRAAKELATAMRLKMDEHCGLCDHYKESMSV